MLGVKPGTKYGYSIYEFSVTGPGSTADLAQGKATTASSYTAPTYPPADATDGNPGTRWAVSVADRAVPDSWLQVDLGSPTQVSGVTIVWEAAYGAAYAIQTSPDGSTWTDAVTVPETHVVTGGWVNVDSRAGFVVRGSGNPLTVTANAVTLSDGPATGAAGMVVQAFPAQPPSATAAAAGVAQPSGGPAGLAAAVTDGYLTLFNLTAAAVSGPLTLPASGELIAYPGSRTGSAHQVSLPAATAAVLAPRFAVRAGDPAALTVLVTDSQHVRLTSTRGDRVTVTPLPGRRGARTVVLRPGVPVSLTFPEVPLAPVTDLALGRTTFPTSPLPSGMSDPAAAVDGDPHTGWRPGPNGRMVVDLGASVPLGTLALTWGPGRPPSAVVTVSDDGLSYRPAGTVHGHPLPLSTTARYVAVAVSRPGVAQLTGLSVSPG
jgi:F5/8 type C domain